MSSIPRFGVFAIGLCLSVTLLSGCATTASLAPFTTDGCSLFPDRSLSGRTDWCDCCVQHDLAYWRGGSADDRLRADRDLRQCVEQKADSHALAELMFSGVRVGGSPYWVTPYRWGYGWRYGRGYAPLTASEVAQADALQADYLARNGVFACPRPATEPTKRLE